MTVEPRKFRVVFVVGDTGSGKTSYLFASGREHLEAGWTAYYVGGIDERDPPLGMVEAFDLREAIECGADNDLWIGLDEVSLEITRGSEPSAELRAIAQFRRHFKCVLVCNSQRPEDLPPKIRDIDTEWRFMRCRDPSTRTMMFIKRNWPDVAAKVPFLEPYAYKPGGPAPVAGVHYIIAR